MSALTTGVAAPMFKLPQVDGGEFSLADALQHGPVLLAFFKISCPICQYAFPLFDRLHQALREKGISVTGISQDNQRDTAAFMREFGVSFTVALEDLKSYKVSNAYGLTNVPTLFEIETDGRIAIASVGWSRADVESIFRKYADDGPGAAPLFKPSEAVADFRAG